ncbi:ketopantoate hydroxymethyltransferase-domain-containing protein [Lasiosphaeria miniovina]|uniref:3-methyl-2-oxobutanoate hydroxymethyltransferase n=1 Tax=Lasiosphaeria miniovina TaxID=1954250 RepID=A0AA40A5J7_9PEZI|nr:ketopantoate hydroxymethyltransferase-domain-containing protein [Lasiosphaeria miniovina]KAK0709667.1 ketopantoate hydroxymethyltransferase-domain-containing protein [Lasiosphaeria miniovina]
MGTPPANPRKKVTIGTLRSLHKRGEPITMITAHDFPSAHVADAAGMDMVLVGDSLAMVALGMEDTSEIVLEEMLLHCRSVARATKAAFTVGDLSMGSYEIAPQQALETAIRFIKEGRMQGIKLEGGKEMAPTIAKITTAGIPVLGHVGLTPQRQNALGGFRVQGKTALGAVKVLEDALAVQEAGCFAVVLEAVPAEVAVIVTRKLSIPTIGIGAGNGCSGQVLVQVDMTGNFPPGRFLPKFVKKYGDVWAESLKAIEAYRDDVKSRQYPAPEHTYPIPKDELVVFAEHANKLIGILWAQPNRTHHPEVLFTYKNTLSLTAAPKLHPLLTVTTSTGRGRAAPTGLKRTLTFSCGNPPAAARAAVASCGKAIKTVDADIVKGRCFSG